MPFSDISTLDINVLLATLSDLGVTLTEEQRKYFEDYCRDLIYADPEHAAQKILAEIERLAKKKLNTQEKEKLSAAEKRNKWDDLQKKEKNVFIRKEKPINLEQSRLIIEKAAQKLGLGLSKRQIDKATRKFSQQLQIGESALDRANSALLNVVKVGIAGGIRIIVQYNWGNLIHIPDYSTTHGLAAIDQGNRLDLVLSHGGDLMGAHFRSVMNILSLGKLHKEFQDFVKINAPLPLHLPTPLTHKTTINPPDETNLPTTKLPKPSLDMLRH